MQMDKRGPEHVNDSTSYQNFALIYKDLGDLEKTKEYQQRVLETQLHKLDPEHVNDATS